MSQTIARVAVKIKFTRLCVLDVPAAAQSWNNASNGGGTKDDFIIIKVIDAKKDFRLTSPFRHISKF